MYACFEDQHLALPLIFHHVPITDDWRAAVEPLCPSQSIIDFCLKNEKIHASVCQTVYQEALDESLSWLPQDISEIQRLILEVIILHLVSAQVSALEQTQHKLKSRHIPYLGASIQHRLTRALLHFSPEDHFRLFEEVPTWNLELAKNSFEWKTDFVGAASVVRVIKAIILTRRPCTIWLPNLYEDVFGGIDLCVELLFGGMYISVKSSYTSLDTFYRTWHEIKAQENPSNGLSYNAALTNGRYDQLWFPIKILVGRSKEMPYDTRIPQHFVQTMHRTISEAVDLFTVRMRPTFIDPQETFSETL